MFPCTKKEPFICEHLPGLGSPKSCWLKLSLCPPQGAHRGTGRAGEETANPPKHHFPPFSTSAKAVPYSLLFLILFLISRSFFESFSSGPKSSWLQGFPHNKTPSVTLPIPTVTSCPPGGRCSEPRPLKALLGGLIIVLTR